MSQLDYQIAVFTNTGTQIDLIDMSRVSSLQYTRVLNGVGDFAITFASDTDRAFEYFEPADYIFEIYRRNTEDGAFEKEATYFHRYTDIFESEQTGRETLIIGGKSLEYLLSGRRINPDDDPLGAAGFSTKSGFCDAVMTSFVENQCVNPALNNPLMVFPGLSLAPTLNIPFQTFQRRKLEDNLLDVLQDISQQALSGGVRADFRISRTSGANFLFEALQIGGDLSVTANFPFTQSTLFDPKRGNLSNPRLTIDRREEVTYVYVGGQGPEENRVYYPVTVPAKNDSPFNVRVDTTDSRENTDVDGLLSAGYAYLEEKGRKLTFSFQPEFLTSQGKYNVDWTLGDIVTAAYRGFSFDYRITQVAINVTADREDIQAELTRYVR